MQKFRYRGLMDWMPGRIVRSQYRVFHGKTASTGQQAASTAIRYYPTHGARIASYAVESANENATLGQVLPGLRGVDPCGMVA